MKKYIPHLGKTQEHILSILKDGGHIMVFAKKGPQGNVIVKNILIDRFNRKLKISKLQIDAMMAKGLLKREAILGYILPNFMDWKYTIRTEIKILIENAHEQTKRRKESNV